MRLTLETPPADTPVDLASAKLHCRIDTSDEDDYVETLINAATQYLDGPGGILGRAIVSQTWLLELDAWPETLTLPVEPILSIAVSYIDVDGIEQTLDAAAYVTSTSPKQPTQWRWTADAVRPALQATEYPVRFTVVAGYGAAADAPAPIKTAILMLVAHWYNQREAVATNSGFGEMPLAFQSLIATFARHI